MLTFALDMEIKKTPQADMEQRRATGFLLGLIFVLAVCYVALEWNSTESAGDGIDPIDLTDLMHETELVPMSNEEFITQLEEKQLSEKGEQLNIVDDDVEVENNEEEIANDDEQLLKELEQEQDDKALAPLEVDPQNPLNFHVSRRLAAISRWCCRVSEMVDTQPALPHPRQEPQDAGEGGGGVLRREGRKHLEHPDYPVVVGRVRPRGAARTSHDAQMAARHLPRRALSHKGADSDSV